MQLFVRMRTNQARIFRLGFILSLILMTGTRPVSVLATENQTASTAIPVSVSVAPTAANSPGQDPGIVEIRYFYLSACPSCKDTENFLAALSDQLAPSLREKGLSLAIFPVNTFHVEGLSQFQKFCEKKGIVESQRLVPSLFVGTRFFSGEDDIREGLQAYLETAPVDELESLPIAKGGAAGAAQENTPEIGAGVAATFAQNPASPLIVGFLNGLTPCSLSMLLFFISLMMARETSILLMGLLYCTGKFATYLLLGTTFYRALDHLSAPWLNDLLRWGMLAAVLLFAVFNLLDMRAAAGSRYDRIRLQLPVGVRKMNHHLIKRLSSVTKPGFLLPLALVLGVATSLGEFLCTGQLYLASILMMVHGNAASASAVPAGAGNPDGMVALVRLLAYNFAFILPPLITTLLLHFGRGIFQVSEFFRINMKWVKLANGVIFLGFGLVLAFGR